MSDERLEKIRNRISHMDPAKGEIFGLYNVNERIRLRAGDDYGISIDSKYGYGTTVCIKLPYMVSEA